MSSSPMVSKWPVLVSIPLRGGDLDDHGTLTAAAAERLFAEARGAYLGRVRSLAGLGIEVADVAVRRAAAPVDTHEVTVSVSVVEVFPDRFTMHVRVRPAEGDGIAAEGSCSVVPGGAVTDQIRDELIALAHGASHYH